MSTLQTMPAPYYGECLCGDVHVTIPSEPQAIMTCACDHCRKNAGGTHQVIGKFLSRGVEIKGQDSIATFHHSDTGSGSPKQKHFCQKCGVTLWTVPASATGTHLMVRTAILHGG
ncbi:Mss4-like protein [Phaeosphaeria sp. MPI-PUGE-AT-0046c]|nr:Mss4-like protein [Phaeosphaeria sp. MPI-PUGE-AT-0046c]